MSALLGDNFDSTPLTGQLGANLFKFPGKHKVRLVTVQETKRNPGVGVDATLIASTSGRLQEGAGVGWPIMKGKFPEYFVSALKRLVGYGLGADPEKVTKKHVEAVLAKRGEPIKGKIISIETTAPNAEGFSNINILGGDEVVIAHKEPAAGMAYDPKTDPENAASGAADSAEDPLGDLKV